MPEQQAALPGRVKTVTEALSDVMHEVREVAKAQRYTGKGSYNFRGVDDVVNAVAPALRRHGVIVIPEVLNHNIVGKASSSGTPMTFVNVHVRYTFHGPDGSTVTGSVVAESWDSGDKATAKAMSVAYRTWWLQALALPTEDLDPDEQVYEGGRPDGVDWEGQLGAAIHNGPDTLVNFLRWAQRNGAPAATLKRGVKFLDDHAIAHDITLD